MSQMNTDGTESRGSVQGALDPCRPLAGREIDRSRRHERAESTSLGQTGAFMPASAIDLVAG